MSLFADLIERVLLIAGPVIVIIGGLVTIWSVVRTRRRYYEEFMRNRDR
jgi:hypothetical protein